MKKIFVGLGLVVLVLTLIVAVWALHEGQIILNYVRTHHLQEVSVVKTSDEKDLINSLALAAPPKTALMSIADGKNNTTSPQASPSPGQAFPSVDDLPKISDAQKLARGSSSEQMPAALLTKIEPLIRVNHLAKESPTYEPQALKFYETCANRADLMNAVRARCLNHLRSLAQKRGEPVDLSQYSARLIHLSEFINL